MKKMAIANLVIICSLLMACGTAEESPISLGGSVESRTGSLYLSGVEIEFNISRQSITLNNKNDIEIKAFIADLDNDAVLVDDWVTLPGSSSIVDHTIFSVGDQVEIRLWKGIEMAVEKCGGWRGGRKVRRL